MCRTGYSRSKQCLRTTVVQYSGRTTARTSAGRFKPTRDRAFRRHVFVGLRSRAVSYCKPRAFVPTPYMLVTSSVDPPQGTTCGVNVYRDNVYSCRELRKYSTHDGPRQQDAARRQLRYSTVSSFPHTMARYPILRYSDGDAALVPYSCPQKSEGSNVVARMRYLLGLYVKSVTLQRHTRSQMIVRGHMRLVSLMSALFDLAEMQSDRSRGTQLRLPRYCMR